METLSRHVNCQIVVTVACMGWFVAALAALLWLVGSWGFDDSYMSALVIILMSLPILLWICFFAAMFIWLFSSFVLDERSTPVAVGLTFCVVMLGPLTLAVAVVTGLLLCAGGGGRRGRRDRDHHLPAETMRLRGYCP